jgi:hypothetical protein
VRHGFPVTGQLVPAVQSAQVPWWQTLFVPQFVPSASELPLSVHTGVPDEQSRAPLWQALVGWQVAPVVHATHAPALHTMLVPQPIPSGALPASLHTGVPVVQLIWPSLQGWPVRGHEAPSSQAMHVPLEHTIPVPHMRPSDWFCPVSWQLATPLSHAVRPTWHGLLSGQVAPAPSTLQVDVTSPPPPSLRTMSRGASLAPPSAHAPSWQPPPSGWTITPGA